MSNKSTIPHTMNAINAGLSNNTTSNSEFIGVSQKGLNEIASSEGTFIDAPSDGGMYVRQNGKWVKVEIVTEAPLDSKTYARKNSSWVEVVSGAYGG